MGFGSPALGTPARTGPADRRETSVGRRSAEGSRQTPLRTRNDDPIEMGALGAIERQHAIGVMGFDPALQKPGWHGEVSAAIDDGFEFQAAEPAREDIFPELCPEPALDARPSLRRSLVCRTRDAALAGRRKGTVILAPKH